MSIKLLGHVTAAGDTSFSCPSSDTTGAALIAVAVAESAAGLCTLSDNYSNSWSLRGQAGFGTASCSIYTAFPSPAYCGPSHFINANGSSGMRGCLSVGWFSLIDVLNPYDNSANTAGTFISTADAGTFLPSVSNELLLSAFAWSASLGSMSITDTLGGMSFAILDQTNFAIGVNEGCALAWGVKALCEGAKPQWSFTGTATGGTVTVAIRAAWGGANQDGPFDGISGGLSQQRI